MFYHKHFRQASVSQNISYEFEFETKANGRRQSLNVSGGGDTHDYYSDR